MDVLYYVKGSAVYQRPVRIAGGTAMGFRVCEVSDGVDPAEVCRLLNMAEKPPERDDAPTSAAERAERKFNEA